MNAAKAKTLITLLADGIDPTTGEIFDANSPYQNPDVIRALNVAVKGIERLERQEQREKDMPSNVGKSWGQEEDAQLVEKFDQGITIKQLSVMHARTEGAIRSRLARLIKASLNPFE